MPKGASGRSFHSTAGGNVEAEYLQLAGPRVMRAAATVLDSITSKAPELKPFLNLLELNQADIRTQGVLAFYDTFNRNVVIGNKMVDGYTPADNGHLVVPSFEGTVAHEIGHALSYHKQDGFRSVEKAIDIAYKQYNRGNANKLSRSDFIGTISRYAGASPHEAFAEAFADWSVNGANANRASTMIVKYWRGTRVRGEKW